MNNYYVPSGKFSPTSFIYFLLLSFIAFPILGLLYAYCIWYIPFIYINFLIAAGVGFVAGLLTNTIVIGKGKVRNVLIAAIFGVLAGFITLYFHWAVWVDLVINAGESYGNSRIGVTVSNVKIFQVFSLVLHPDVLFELIGEINEFGTWGIKGSTVSGGFLTAIWIIELVIIVGISTLMSFIKAQQPFCERSNSWFEEIDLGTFDYIENTTEVIAQLERKNSELIENIHPNLTPGIDHSIFTLYTSTFDESYLTIENKKAKTEKDGKISFDGDEFVEYISITKALKDILSSKKNSTT